MKSVAEIMREMIDKKILFQSIEVTKEEYLRKKAIKKKLYQTI